MRKPYALAIILSILQVLDGCLTYLGVVQFGIEGEGNPLIKQAIELCGTFWGLFFAKALGLLVIWWWWLNHFKEVRTRRAFLFLIVFYVVFAVLPWLLILGILPSFGYLPTLGVS